MKTLRKSINIKIQEKEIYDPTTDKIYNSIHFKYADFEPIELKNFKIGNTIILQGIHNYHDVNGSTHNLVIGPHHVKENNDSQYGNRVLSNCFKIERISKQCIKLYRI